MEWREKYHKEIELLHSRIDEMGTLVIDQIHAGLEAMESRDEKKAQLVIDRDEQVDAMQSAIEDLGTKLIATEQPVAGDLREIVSAIKVVSSIARIGDHAKHLAKGVERITGKGSREFIPVIREMAEKGVGMLDVALKAFNTGDSALAQQVALKDEEIDAIKKELNGKLMEFMRLSPDNIQDGVSLLFLNRFMERLGDHVTTLCEWVYFTSTGKHIDMN